MEIPTGQVSFLFTDVEASTQLWEDDPDGMAESLALHDHIVRDSAHAHGGYVFSQAGDAFGVAFCQVKDAVSAAVDVQRRLVRADWSGPAIAVRMGIHTGTADERDGDYFGLSVNRAARIMAAGNGGQILLSWLTADRLETCCEVELHDLGTHHLKDLADGEHVFEVRHPDLPVVEAPIRTIDIRNDNLPAYLTSFVGRSEELAHVGRLLEGNRLVTLTGVGGTGKTRLAVEAASAVIEAFQDGAWIVELARLTNPAAVMMVLADTLGLRPAEGVSIETAVLHHLGQRHSLLILDNCEHVLNGVAEAVKLVLDGCPQQRVLATSRVELGLVGERTLRVPSLTVPDGRMDVAKSEAVELFVDRARVARGVELTDEELPHVVRICRRVDGIPLGIELAAARLRSMSTAELADQLDQSLRILSGSSAARLPRQQTLQATIDWSYDLLTPAEQAMFRRLSVFVGGFDLPGAAAVCGKEGNERWEVLDEIDALVGKSLVTPIGIAGGATRYRLLEPLRHYGLERLKDSTESASIRGHHANYFRQLAAQASPQLNGPSQSEWASRLDSEADNIRAAFTTFLELGDIDRYLDMVFDMYTHWVHKGNDIEGVEIGLAGLEAAATGTETMRLVKACWTTSELAAEFCLPEGVEVAKRGLDLALAAGEPSAVGRMRLALGRALFAVANDGFDVALREAAELLDAHPGPNWWDPTWERGLFTLIPTIFLPADTETKRERIEGAAEAFEAVGDQVFMASALSESIACYREGDREVKDWVVTCNRRACEVLSEANSPGWYAHALWYLGGVLRREGDLWEAVDYLRRGVTRLDTVGDVVCWANASTTLSTCESQIGRHEDARRHLVAVIREMPIPPRPDAFQAYIVQSAIDVLWAGGDHERAAVALGASLAFDFPEEAYPARADDLEDARSRLYSVIGEEVADPEIEDGHSLSLEAAFDLVSSWLAED